MLLSRPARMEEIFSELSSSGQLQDAHLRNALLEQRLKRLKSGEVVKNITSKSKNNF